MVPLAAEPLLCNGERNGPMAFMAWARFFTYQIDREELMANASRQARLSFSVMYMVMYMLENERISGRQFATGAEEGQVDSTPD
jgi:hypothetical protein